jgi:hypothetical protein
MPNFVRQVADFAGIEVTDEIVAKVAQNSTIEKMKQSKFADCSWIPHVEGAKTGHLRSGGKGGWRDVFSAEQNAEFDALIATGLAGTDLKYDYGDGVKV